MTPARYCQKCGAKTVLVETGTDFNRETGEKQVWLSIDCPRRSGRPNDHYASEYEYLKAKTSPELSWWTQGEGSK